MATLKIEPAENGKLSITLTRFSAVELARLKRIPGHRGDPARKPWEFRAPAETRAALADIVAMPLSLPPKLFAVKPKHGAAQPHRVCHP